MSLNLFPNAGPPSFTEDMDDRVQPRGPGKGEGPYGSYNDDEKGELGDLEQPPVRNLDQNDSDHPPKWASDPYTEAEVQDVLDHALERAGMLLNPLLTKAIRDHLPLGLFNEQAYAMADDLLETCVYEELVDRGNTDLRNIAPVALVEFLDIYMVQQRGRAAALEELLKEAYFEYFSSKNQPANG